MPEQTFELNGKTVTVDVEDDDRMMEVIRELVGSAGPRTSGCGIACSACPSHNPASPCEPSAQSS